MGIEEKKKGEMLGWKLHLSVCGIVKICQELYYKLALWITVIHDASLNRDTV